MHSIVPAEPSDRKWENRADHRPSLMVAVDDQLVPVRQDAQPIVEACYFGSLSLLREITAVNEHVAVRNRCLRAYSEQNILDSVEVSNTRSQVRPNTLTVEADLT
jgi:hypothetical protein